MEALGNLWLDWKRLLIKQTSYSVLAQSKSKSPTINKKKNPLGFVCPKSSGKVCVQFCWHSLLLQALKFKVPHLVLCFFLPVQSSLVKCSLIQLSVCLPPRVCKSLCGREIWETVILGATEWIWLCAQWLDPSFCFCAHPPHTLLSLFRWVAVTERVNSLPVPLSVPHPVWS